jgi:hypothetical protein
MNKLLTIIYIFIVSSCARVQTLNIEPHNYSQKPDHVIWIQLAGFSSDHIPLIKYNNQLSQRKTWFETADCSGKMFDYNLFNLRVDAEKSFLSQLLGSKKIINNCTDFDRHFIWEKFKKDGYKVSILEKNISKEDSIEKLIDCNSEFKNDFSEIRFWKMASGNVVSSPKYFHFQDTEEKINSYLLDGTYSDKSCQNGICFSSVLNNIKTLYSRLAKENAKTFLLIRDFSYLNALKKKQIFEARDILNEVDQLLKWTQSIKSNTLVLISGAEVINFDYPSEGEEWELFLKSGKNFTYKSTSLMSSVIAKGAMAENFCGIFEEADIYRRLEFKTPAKKFNLDFINPFSN